MDGFLYSGNPHESFPRALLCDKRLTPLERNAWLMLRSALNADGLTAFPTYEQMAVYLASMPCARASHETVARALTMLRLTRWISLVRRRRNTRNGRIQGNVYVLHDSPLTPFEAMQLDAEYLGLVGKALNHASKSIQRVGAHILKEISEDPMLRGKLLPSHLQNLITRLAVQGWESYPQEERREDSEEGRNDSEDGQNALLRNREAPVSESEPGENPRQMAARNPKSDSTVRSTVRINKYIKEVHTVLRARKALRIPERFEKLRPEQQAGAWMALEAVDARLHQAIFDEWEARCRDSAVRNPAGYLFGIIQKALRGTFHAWAGGKEQGKPPGPEALARTHGASAIGADKAAASGPGRENPSACSLAASSSETKPATAAQPASAERAQEYLAQIRAILHQPRPP